VGWLLRRARPSALRDPHERAVFLAGARVAEARLVPKPFNRGMAGRVLELEVRLADAEAQEAVPVAPTSYAEAAATTRVATLDQQDSVEGGGGGGAQQRDAPAHVASLGSDDSEEGGSPRESKATAPHTLQLMVKLSTDSEGGRVAVQAGGRAREAHFLASSLGQEVRALLPGALPRLLEAYGSDLLGEYVIITEDVRAREGGAADVNLLLGNQIWGTPPGAAKPLDDPLPVLRRAFAQAAHVHAHFWCDARLRRTPWLKAAPWYAGRGRREWERAIAATKRYWTTAKSRWAQPASGVELSDRLCTFVDNSLNGASWKALQQRLHANDAVFTLTHGDFHAANMLQTRPDSLGQDDAPIVLVDWSEVGLWEPTTDLGQMLISDLRPDVVRQHAEPLVRHYWETLVAVRPDLAEAYPWARCWKDFCRATIERWTFLFAVLAGFDGVPGVLVTWFHDNLLSFVETFYSGHDMCNMSTLVMLS
jgi:hypothetical protein